MLTFAGKVELGPDLGSCLAAICAQVICVLHVAEDGGYTIERFAVAGDVNLCVMLLMLLIAFYCRSRMHTRSTPKASAWENCTASTTC